MIRLLFVTAIAACLALSSLASGEESAPSADAGLYYAAEENFDSKSNIELRLGAGQDFSNSFLSIYGFSGGALYLIDPHIAFGLEGTLYANSRKGSAVTLADEMARQGYLMHAVGPQARAVGLLRVTPISGMVNLFSKDILKVDISLLARAGGMRYQVVGWGPTAGLGLETLLGITPNFGVSISMHYDVEKPGSEDWLWRAGVMVGPTVRF